MKILKWMALIVATLLLAIAIFAYRLQAEAQQLRVLNGDYSTPVNAGSSDASAIERTSVAIVGLLASKREDSVYYHIDSIKGEPLSIACTYVLTGGSYDANWFSITAYAWDNHLIPNDQERYSFNSEQLRGQWQVRISATPQPGNWLPIGPASDQANSLLRRGDHDFDLLVRFYTPGKAYLNNPESAALPQLVKESCQ